MTGARRGPGRWQSPPTRPVGVRRRLLAALVVASMLLGGCSPPGVASTGAGSDTFAVSAAAAVTTVLADLEEFWRAELPAIGGPEFTAPVGGYHPVDATAAGAGALCVTRPAQITGNAFYCPDQDGLVWDSSGLVPVLYGRGGTGAVAAAFAHEYGHAIQARGGPSPAQRTADPVSWPTLLIEAQADCYSGSFLAWVRDSRSTREQLTVQELLPAVQPLLDFRDPPGMLAVDPAAHGRGVDRAGFVLRGLRSGAASCRVMTTADLPLDRRTDDSKQPRFSGPDAAVADAAASVAALAAGWPAQDGDRSAVPAAPDAADLDTARLYGQFATATAAALATGRAVTGTADGAACFVGAWAATVVAAPTAGGLGARAADPDEALDLIRHRPGAMFTDLAAFTDGWTRGPAGCP